MNSFNKYFLIVFIACISFVSNAREIHNQYRFASLTIDDGLANNRTTCITQDKYGFIWIGTDDGASRYDGATLKTYNTYLNNKHDQYNQQVTAFYSDSHGNLLQGALDLYIFNFSTDRFEPFFDDSIKNTPRRIRFMEETDRGSIWLGARNGLFKIIPETRTFRHMPSDKGTNYEIWSLTATQRKVFLGTRNNGLVVYDLTTETYTKVPLLNEKGDTVKVILNVYMGLDKTLWVGTKYNGIFKVNSSDFSLITHDYPDEKCRRIRRVIHDKKGTIWIGTMEGLYVYDKINDTYTNYAHTFHQFSSITHNSVFNLFIDKQENLWLSTYAGGVNYTNLLQKPFTVVTEKENNKAFLNNGIVAGFAEDAYGNIYVGTDHGGLNILDKKTCTFKYIKHGDGKISGTNIKCLERDHLGRIWIGTYSGGITIYNPVNKHLEYIASSPQNPSLLTNNIIYSLSFDEKTQSMWVGTNGGVDCIDANTLKVETSIQNGEINQVLCDNHGIVWIGASGKGLYTYNRQSKETRLFNDSIDLKSIYWIYRDSNNQLWIGGKDGLSMVNIQNHGFLKYTEKDGLSSNIILGILEDASENIWISSSSGLSKCIGLAAHPDSLILHNYTSNDGLQSNQFWRGAAFKDATGRMYFGGVKGFNAFYPDSIKNNPYVADVAITGLSIFNKPVQVGQTIVDDVVLKKSLSEQKEISLSYKHTVFTLEFVALHFADPQQNKFAYKLEPIDEDWNYTKLPRNFVTYTFLPGGEYVFKVKAANGDGVWNETPVALNIKIVPPFWKTYWFYMLVLVFVAACIILFYYIRVANIEKQKKQLEATVKKRTEEISTMNATLVEQKKQLQDLIILKDKFLSIVAHDLRNPFQSLMGFSKILKMKYSSLPEEKKVNYINIIHTSSNKIFNLLENLLTWARSQTDTMRFEPIPVNLKELVDENIQLLDTNLLKDNLTIANEVPEAIYLLADANMLHSIVRNLLNNAIKFTDEDGDIRIMAAEEKEQIHISFKDNGIGMNKETLENLFESGSVTESVENISDKGSGLGLMICKEFVEKHRGKIWVESEKLKGSIFHITLPKPK